MSLQLRIADCSKQTAGYLKDLLRERGMQVVVGEAADATVCYGYGGVNGKRVLNGKAGVLNNLQQIQKLHDAGLLVPPFSLGNQGIDLLKFPLFARKNLHIEGQDIKPVFQPEEIPWRKAAGATFFTEFVPHVREYRIWTFRDEALASYVKVMNNPAKYVHIGNTFRNGFVTEYVESARVPEPVKRLAIKATAAMDLDFGGVDILEGKNGRYYVLEVNTAPGANGPQAIGIKKFANRIKGWVDAGYPAR